MAGKRSGFESPKLHQIRIYLLLSQKTHKRFIAVNRPLCRPRGQKCGSNLLRPIPGTACLVTAVVSVVTALREKRFSRIHILDLVWILPMGAMSACFYFLVSVS
jgi:hypothetical protein